MGAHVIGKRLGVVAGTREGSRKDGMAERRSHARPADRWGWLSFASFPVTESACTAAGRRGRGGARVCGSAATRTRRRSAGTRSARRRLPPGRLPRAPSLPIALRRPALSGSRVFMVNSYTCLIGLKQSLFPECEDFPPSGFRLVRLTGWTEGAYPRDPCAKKIDLESMHPSQSEVDNSSRGL